MTAKAGARQAEVDRIADALADLPHGEQETHRGIIVERREHPDADGWEYDLGTGEGMLTNDEAAEAVVKRTWKGRNA